MNKLNKIIIIALSSGFLAIILSVIIEQYMPETNPNPFIFGAIIALLLFIRNK